MKKTNYAVPVLLTCFLIPLGSVCFAQVVDVSDCRVIEDRLRRFDCYEQLGTSETASPQEGTARPVLPVPPRTATSPAVAEPAPEARADAVEDGEVAEFGRKVETSSVREITDREGETELLDTIASLEKRNPSSWLITLMSGQKWRQMLDKRYPIEVGDEVRIYPSRWGNAYRLTATRVSGYIQVERID